MRVSTILRITPAIWLAPVLTLLAVYYASITVPATPEPYAPAVTAAGAVTVFFIAPACAALGAWEGGRLRRAGWWGVPHVRSTAQVALWSVGCVMLVGVFAVTAAVAFKLFESRVPTPDAGILAIAFVVVGAHCLVGLALGLTAPVVVSVPTALAVDYAWMVLPAAVGPDWLGHLNGYLFACCDVAEEMAPRAMAASSLVAFGLAASAYLLMVRRLGRPHLIVVAVPVVLALGVGSALVHRMGLYPTTYRDSALVCSSGIPRVCVWPEHRQRLSDVSVVAMQASQAWQRFGIVMPREFTEQRFHSLPPGIRTFGIWSGSGRDDILLSLAYGVAAGPPPCAAQERSPWPGARARPYAFAWLAEVAGVSPSVVAGIVPRPVSGVVAKARGVPAGHQRTWIERNLAAIHTCDLKPELDASA